MSKKTFIMSVFILCLLALPLKASAQGLKGDVNGDGTLTIKDVTMLINYLLTNDPTGINLENADVYEDGIINIHDVTNLINTLLTVPDEPQDEHERVDLGLPSGTLWATCNVGASSPEEYGDYFAWGETEPKDYYDWSTYKWCNGSSDTMTKYCTDSILGYNGFTDGKTELDPEDDAAYVNWGSSWRMPTIEQQIELIGNCSWTWTTQNGVKGYLVTGANGNSIFLPAAGRYGRSLYQVGSNGYYRSGALWSGGADNASSLFFHSMYVGLINGYRYYGYTVRAVCISQN